MATVEERHKILEMVAEGKISAQEAASLLSATAAKEVEEEVPEAQEVSLSEPAESLTQPEKLAPAAAKEREHEAPAGPSWLRVRVSDLASGRNKVSVNIPLRLMRAGLQLGSSFAPELRNVDWERFSASLAEGEGGLLVEVQDEEDGEHVRIFIE